MDDLNSESGHLAEWINDFNGSGSGESEFHSWALDYENYDLSLENPDNGEMMVDLKLSGMLDIASELSNTLEDGNQEYPNNTPNEYLRELQNSLQINPLKTELSTKTPTPTLTLTPTSTRTPTPTAPTPTTTPSETRNIAMTTKLVPPTQPQPLPKSTSINPTTVSSGMINSKDKKRRGSTDNSKTLKKTKTASEQPIAPRPVSSAKKAQPPTIQPQPQTQQQPQSQSIQPHPPAMTTQGTIQTQPALPYFAVASPKQQLLKPVQSTTPTSSTPVYTLPANTLANVEETEKKIGKLLDDNANLINVMRENLMNGKMNDNVDPMNRFHKNVYTVLSWLSGMPGIMGEMPPLPVKLSTCFLPSRGMATSGGPAFGITGYPIGAPIAVTNGNQIAHIEGGQLVGIVPVHSPITNGSSSNTTVKSVSSKSTPVPVKPKLPNILPSPTTKSAIVTTSNANYSVKL